MSCNFVLSHQVPSPADSKISVIIVVIVFYFSNTSKDGMWNFNLLVKKSTPPAFFSKNNPDLYLKSLYVFANLFFFNRTYLYNEYSFLQQTKLKAVQI